MQLLIPLNLCLKRTRGRPLRLINTTMPGSMKLFAELPDAKELMFLKNRRNSYRPVNRARTDLPGSLEHDAFKSQSNSCFVWQAFVDIIAVRAK